MPMGKKWGTAMRTLLIAVTVIAAGIVAWVMLSSRGGGHAAPVSGVNAESVKIVYLGGLDVPDFMPFHTPFIELSATKIVQSVEMSFANDATEPAMVDEFQQTRFDFSLPQSLAAQEGYLSISVAGVDVQGKESGEPSWFFSGIAADTRSVQYGRVENGRSDYVSRPASRLIAGEYLVRLGFYAAANAPSQTGKPLAEAVRRLTVRATADTSITFYDVLSDRTIRYGNVKQLISTADEPLWRGSLFTPAWTEIETLMDDTGEKLEFTREMTGNIARYRYRLHQPIQVGEPIATGENGKMTGLFEELPDGIVRYVQVHDSWNRKTTRRVDVFRLPVGATLLEKLPSNTQVQEYEGQIQLYVDQLLNPDTQPAVVSFQYRLPQPPTTRPVENSDNTK